MVNIGFFFFLVSVLSLSFGFKGWVGCDVYLEVLFQEGILSFRFLSCFTTNVVYTFIIVFLYLLYFLGLLYCEGFLVLLRGRYTELVLL